MHIHKHTPLPFTDPVTAAAAAAAYQADQGVVVGLLVERLAPASAAPSQMHGMRSSDSDVFCLPGSAYRSASRKNYETMVTIA
jgi:hypothetical protein